MLNKKDRDNIICSLYKKNKLIGEIAKILSIDRHTVSRTLKKFNLYDANKAKNRLNSEKIKRNEEIIQLYQTGMSFRQVAKRMGVGHTTVEYVIHTFIKKTPIQYSIDVDNKNSLIRHRKYDFDTNFFEKIDTQEKAYWLGFLYADGCITHKEVRLELQAKDLLHLKKFLTAINAFTKEPRYRKETNSYLIYLNSKKMINDLIELGCMQRKTFLIQFPTEDQVPDVFIRHFMRGYFDGDGCIYVRKNNSGVNLFSVTGTETFIDSYKIKIEKKNNVKLRQTASKEIKTLELGGNNQIKKIYEFLYRDATIYLNRKKEKFEIINGRLETNSQKSQDYEDGINLGSRKTLLQEKAIRTEGSSKLRG